MVTTRIKDDVYVHHGSYEDKIEIYCESIEVLSSSRIKIDFETIKEIVTNYVRMKKIEEIKKLSNDEILFNKV